MSKWPFLLKSGHSSLNFLCWDPPPDRDFGEQPRSRKDFRAISRAPHWFLEILFLIGALSSKQKMYGRFLQSSSETGAESSNPRNRDHRAQISFRDRVFTYGLPIIALLSLPAIPCDHGAHTASNRVINHTKVVLYLTILQENRAARDVPVKCAQGWMVEGWASPDGLNVRENGQ